jgi:glucose-6-phosphate 1-epimerase
VSIRGGVPVIFPQFAAEGPLPRHGFARTTRWSLVGVSEDQGEAIATLALEDSPATRAIWPAAFRATLTVRVGGPRLAIALDVENTGRSPLSFTAALHSYLRVRALADVALRGLEGCSFRDSGRAGGVQVEHADALRPRGEVDRVYLGVAGPLELREPGRSLTIEATGFPDVVVWNPGPTRAAALADLTPDGERRFLCVEAAAVQRPVVLAPGAHWLGAQHLTVVE